MFPLGRVAQHRHLHPVFGVASDISFDGAFVFIDDAPYQGVVFTLGGFVVELQAQMGLGVRSLGYDYCKPKWVLASGVLAMTNKPEVSLSMRCTNPTCGSFGSYVGTLRRCQAMAFTKVP